MLDGERILDCVSLFCAGLSWEKKFLFMFGRVGLQSFQFPPSGKTRASPPHRRKLMACYRDMDRGRTRGHTETETFWIIQQEVKENLLSFLGCWFTPLEPPLLSAARYCNFSKCVYVFLLLSGFPTFLQPATQPHPPWLGRFLDVRWWSVSVTWLNMLLGCPRSVFVFSGELSVWQMSNSRVWGSHKYTSMDYDFLRIIQNERRELCSKAIIWWVISA